MTAVPRSALYSGLPQLNNESNVAWAIKETSHILTSNATSLIEKVRFAVRTQPGGGTDSLRQGRALRFLLHFVGDVHQVKPQQPCHPISLR
jgi:hypothetical protein